MSPVTTDKIAQCANPRDNQLNEIVEEMGNVRLHGLPMSGVICDFLFLFLTMGCVTTCVCSTSAVRADSFIRPSAHACETPSLCAQRLIALEQSACCWQADYSANHTLKETWRYLL